MFGADFPDRSPAALLLIDVINDFDFPGGVEIWQHAKAIAAPLFRLKRRAKAEGIPVVYVNDNFGQWRSNATTLVDRCSREDARGRELVEAIRPELDDYFVLKPMNSGFYQTPLDLLLRHLGVSTLILTGITTNNCVLCTAHDARMRNLQLYVPGDCCAARTHREHEQALTHLREVAEATVVDSVHLPLAEIMADTSNLCH